MTVKSQHPLINILIALRYKKAAENLISTSLGINLSLSWLLKIKQHDSAILKMKLNLEDESKNGLDKYENHWWPEYIDTLTDPIHINEMYTITKINPNVYPNLIEHLRAHEFSFINLFNTKALAIQLVKSNNTNKIIDICFSHNKNDQNKHLKNDSRRMTIVTIEDVDSDNDNNDNDDIDNDDYGDIDKIAAYFFRYFLKDTKLISVHIPKIHIFIKRLISTELSFDTLTIYVSMISNIINNASHGDKAIMLSLINNNISISKHIMATNLLDIFNYLLPLINN